MTARRPTSHHSHHSHGPRHSRRPDTPDPHNVLCAILSLTLLLASALVLGGLAAHPF